MSSGSNVAGFWAGALAEVGFAGQALSIYSSDRLTCAREDEITMKCSISTLTRVGVGVGISVAIVLSKVLPRFRYPRTRSA